MLIAPYRRVLAVFSTLLLLILLSGCMSIADLGVRIVVVDVIEPSPLPQPFAVEVVGKSFFCSMRWCGGDPVLEELHCNPENALGPPDSPRDVSLGGTNAWIALRLGVALIDGTGPDLRIHEGGDAEPFHVYISSDGASWDLVQENVEKAGNDVDGVFFVDLDISGHTDTYWYVKIVSPSSQFDCFAGADLEAIVVLNSP